MRSLAIFLYNLRGGFFKRIIPSLLRKNFFFKKTIIDLGFCKINLNLKNSIDREIYLKNKYEIEQIKYLQKISENQNIDYFLDIGSYIGYYALYFKNIKNVYAFEPNKKNFAQLVENINLNKSNITACNFACSNLNDYQDIWYDNKQKMGGSSIYKKEDIRLSKYNKGELIFEKIETRRLDDFIKISKKNLIIKMDVEKHEIYALEGAIHTLNNNKITMQIEIDDKLKNEVFNFLKANNFKHINSIAPDHYFKNY